MYTVYENRRDRNTFSILMRNLAILLLMCCNLRQGFSVRIKLFKAEPFGSPFGSIRLSQNQKLSLECEIESSGQPYVASITNEEGIALTSTRDTNNSILQHTIHLVACHDMGALTCEVKDDITNGLITSSFYLMVENCLPRTCKGFQHPLKMVAPLHSNGSLSVCVIADTSRFLDMKVYINGQELKLFGQHPKYRFDVERNEPSSVHYTVHLIVLNVTTADYRAHTITATTGGDYSITFTAQLDGVGRPCLEGWCETEQRTCLQLRKTGNSDKKEKWRCESMGGTLFHGTIRQKTQYGNSSWLNPNRRDHIVAYEDNQTCSVNTWANYTGKDMAEFTATSEFHIACQVPFWSDVATSQGALDPILSTDSSNDDAMSVYVSVGTTLVIVLIGGFIGVVCCRKRGHYKKSTSFKSRLLESSTTTDAAYFEKADRESIYHRLEEAFVATNRDTDDGHDYDLTLDESGIDEFKSHHVKRESIKPLPPPRPSEKNKVGTKSLDMSVYDECSGQCVDQPAMKIDDSTRINIVSIKEEDNNIIEKDFDLLSADTGNTNALEKTLRNQNNNTGNAGKNKYSNTFVELKKITNDYSTPLIAKEEHQYSGYVNESKTKGEESVQPLKHTDACTHLLLKEDICQDLHIKTLDNPTKILEEHNTTRASGNDNDCMINENSKSLTCDSADTEAVQGCYSSPLKRSEDHFYAYFSRADSSSISSFKEKDHNAYDVHIEEHTNDLTDKTNVPCSFIVRSDAFEKSRESYVDFTDQANNADHENYSSSILSKFLHVKECVLRDDDSNKVKDNAVLNCSANSLTRDVISSNNTNVEVNDYVTPLDPVTYPLMINGEEIATKPDDINKENWYLEFDGADCEAGRQMKPGCKSNEEYMTWDGGEVSSDDDVLNKTKLSFGPSSREMVLNENSRNAETSRNQCGVNIEVGNSELQQECLVYWTPDGTMKRALVQANSPLSDEYCAPYDFLRNY